MRKIWLLTALLLTIFVVNAQTFNGTGGSIPGTGSIPTCFSTTVSGVGVINGSYGLASVRISITHPADDELEILLRAPDGTYVPLSVQNGTGANYTNTVFTPTATTPIKFGNSPFTGNFLPEGHIGAVNNGQNANGSWSICILDRRSSGNAGVLNSFTLTFSNTPAPVPPAQPACITNIPNSANCASAPSICDFNGACGSTVSTPKQSWTALDAACCFGLNNNTFVKFIAASTTVSFSVWVTSSTNGFNSANGGIQMLFFSTPSCGSSTVNTFGCYNRIYPYPPSGRPLISVVYATGLTVGNTYYLLMDGANGDQCNFTLAANSGLNEVVITPAAPAICNGGSVNLTASGSNGTYSWSPNTALNTTTGATVTANPTATTNYTVTSITTTGCVLTKDVTVTVNNPPVVTTHPSTDTQRICQNGVITPLTVVATPGSGTITGYQWYLAFSPSYAGAIAIPPATSATYTPSNANIGTFYFFCKVTNSNGCSDTSDISAPIIVSAPVAAPTASVTVQPTCAVATGTITVTAPAGPNIEYSIGGAYQASGTFSNLTAGNYSVTAKNVVTGCTSTATNLTVNPPTGGPAIPTGSVTVQPTCSVPTGTIVVTAPLGANLQYSIGGTYQSSTTFSNLTNGTTYGITAKDNTTGCVSDTLFLTVNTIPGAPATPTATITQPDCVNLTGSVTVTAPVGAGIEYSIGGPLQASTTFTGLIAGNSYSLTATNTATGCVSAPLVINVTNSGSAPAAPGVSNVSYCQGATAAQLTATGTGLLWYTSATGSTGSATAPTPGTITAGNTSYFVSQTNGSCESNRAELVVTINPIPAAPTATATITYCQSQAATALSATGTGLLWYTTATGGTGSTTAPTPNTTTAGSTNYYVSQTVNGCESGRTAILVQVNPTPAAPSVAATPINYCVNATAVALSATGTNLQWYTVATGGTGSAVAPTPSTGTPGTTTYYVSQTVSGCESPRASIDVIINAAPAAPAVSSPINYCENVASAVLTATGTNLLWYTAATGGTGSTTAPTPATNVPGTTTYYVTQTVNGCESNRASIDVNVNALPAAPTVSTPVNYCLNATATALTATGNVLLWYTAATGGTGSSTAPVPSTSATGSSNYYVSQTVNGCEGARATITVTVGAATPLPAVTTPVTYCANATAVSLQATGNGLLWYATATGSTGNATAPTPATNTAGSTFYYVSQTLNGCESGRASIEVIVNALPAAPVVVNASISYCENATAVALTATGNNLQWYNSATGGTGSSIAPVPVTSTAGTTAYYVSQTVNGCESNRTAIDVIVNAIPAAPVVTTPIGYCLNATATALTATGTGLLWYNSATGGTGSNIAPVPSTSATGNSNYYVSQTVNGCESPRATITVAIGAATALPAVTTPVTYCQNATAASLQAIGTNLLWYTTTTGGTGNATAPTPATNTAGSTFYYVSQTLNGCESGRASIEVIVNALPAAPSVANASITYCQNATATVLNATGNNLQWYNSATGGTGSSIAPVPVTTTAGTTTFYVSQTVNGCESNRTAINVLVNATPAAPVIAADTVSYCQNATAVALTATGNSLSWYTTATGGTGSATAPVPTTSVAGNTNYFVTATVNGCESPRTRITVKIIATPTPPTVTTPVIYCQNATAVPLSATGSNLLWYTSNTGGTGDVNAPTPSTATPGNTFYYVTQTVNGCESSPRRAITVTINVSSTAVSSFLYNRDTICINNGLTHGPTNAFGFTTGGTFTATPAGLNINPSTGVITLASSIANTYTVTYTYPTTGCVTGSSSTAPITLLPPVAAVTTFSYASPVCRNEANPVPSKVSGFTEGGVYTATPVNGLSINSSTGEINMATSRPGTYTVTYSVAAAGCRPARSSFSFITIQDTLTPVTRFSYSPATVCITSNTNPTISKAPGFSNLGTFSATPAGLAIDDVTGEITLGLSQPGVYTVNYNVPQFLCQLEGNFNFTLTITPFVTPVVGFSYDGPLCKGAGTALPITDAGFTTGGTFSAAAGLKLDAATGLVDLAQSTAGNYVIRYEVPRGSCNAGAINTAALQVLGQPQKPVARPDTICGRGTATLSATANGAIGWYAESSLVNQLNAGPSFSPDITSTTTYYLTNTVGACVSEAATVTAVVLPLPAAPYIGGDTAICQDDQLVLNASGPYIRYLWQDGSTAPTLTVNKPGEYRVTVSTGARCTASSSIRISVLDNCDDINFPNAFSPNGDGRNDFFGPLGNVFLVKNYTLKVFNRYGEMVFASNNPYQKWDGNYKGKQPGLHNFVWVASYSYRGKREQVRRGNLVIVQ